MSKSDPTSRLVWQILEALGNSIRGTGQTVPASQEITRIVHPFRVGRPRFLKDLNLDS